MAGSVFPSFCLFVHERLIEAALLETANAPAMSTGHSTRNALFSLLIQHSPYHNLLSLSTEPLTKAIIGKDLSRKIAQASPPDLREGWESIEPSPVDYDERVGIY
jgi:hypothetical protein